MIRGQWLLVAFGVGGLPQVLDKLCNRERSLAVGEGRALGDCDESFYG